MFLNFLTDGIFARTVGDFFLLIENATKGSILNSVGRRRGACLRLTSKKIRFYASCLPHFKPLAFYFVYFCNL